MYGICYLKYCLNRYRAQVRKHSHHTEFNSILIQWAAGTGSIVLPVPILPVAGTKESIRTQKANEVDWLKSKGAGVQSVIDSQWVTKWVNSTQHLRKEKGYLCLIHFQVIPFLAPASFILPSTLSGSKKWEPPAWKVGGCEKFSARITRRGGQSRQTPSSRLRPKISSHYYGRTVK